MSVDWKDQLKAVKSQMTDETPVVTNTRVVFEEKPDNGQTVMWFKDDDHMLNWLKASVPTEQWKFKVFHKVGQWVWKEVLNYNEEKEA